MSGNTGIPNTAITKLQGEVAFTELISVGTQFDFDRNAASPGFHAGHGPH